MARRCCAWAPGNDNDGSAMLSPQQRGANDAVTARPDNDNSGPTMLLSASTEPRPDVDQHAEECATSQRGRFGCYATKRLHVDGLRRESGLWSPA